MKRFALAALLLCASPAWAVPPTFDTGVAYVSATVTQMTVSFDASADALTYYCALYGAGFTPSASAVKLGTAALGPVATGATTGASQNVAITADATVHPFYEPHCVVENGDGLSAVSDQAGSLAATPMAAPATCGATGALQCQFVAITSVGVGSPCESFNTAAAPDIASGDVLVSGTTTDEGLALTISAACQFSYGGSLDRQSALNTKVFDASAIGYHASDIDAWFNNKAPVCVPDFTQDFRLNQAAGIDITTFCPDEDDLPADLTIAVTAGSHVTGVSFADPMLTGTATGLGEVQAVTFQATDVPGDTDSFVMSESVIGCEPVWTVGVWLAAVWADGVWVVDACGRQIIMRRRRE